MASSSQRARAVEDVEMTVRSKMRRALRRSRDLDLRIRWIREDDTIPEETKPAVIQQEREEAAEAIRKLVSGAREAHARGLRQVSRYHRSFNPEDPQANDRLARLLEAGVHPTEIVEQAVAARDRDLVEAILRDAHTLRAADGKMGSPDAPSIVAAAEDALAGMSSEERATIEAARSIQSLEERVEAVAKFGEAVISGDPQRHAAARIELGLTDAEESRR